MQSLLLALVVPAAQPCSDRFSAVGCPPSWLSTHTAHCRRRCSAVSVACACCCLPAAVTVLTMQPLEHELCIDSSAVLLLFRAHVHYTRTGQSRSPSAVDCRVCCVWVAALQYGSSGLMFAAAAGHLPLVKHLVESRAEIDARGKVSPQCRVAAAVTVAAAHVSLLLLHQKRLSAGSGWY